MENSIKSISTDLFYKVRSRFSGLKLGKETGETTINPEEAVFFDFDYMEGENPLGHVSISLAEPTSMKVYYSTGITETMTGTQKNGWYDFLGSLREFAKRRLMNFDTRDIAKDNLDKRDFAFLSQYTNKAASGENTMSESMYGTTKTSYQKLNDTKLIIKHKKQVDENVPGSRARNISALFVENQDGERFKYPFIHLAGARAMQRHVANGGVPYDEIGQHIISMSEQIAQLKSFDNYVVRNDLLNSDTNNIVERSKSELQRCREEIQRLSKQTYYEQFKENFQGQASVEVPEDVIEELTNKFTVKNFKEDIKSVFPLIYKLMQEENTLGYDDIVEMTQEQAINDEAEIVEDHEDEFDKFESWVMNLGEASPIQSSDDEEQKQAIDSLNKLTKDHFPAGVDGQNAIQALKGIIEDPALDKALKQASKEDADTCVRPVIKQWLEQNAPEALDQIDFGDMTEEPQEQEPEENPKEGEELQQQKSGVRELAEFINSFYDKQTGTFPKGPEGVVTMVGKKFGEQAEQLARKFVERMAPQQTTEQNPELAELARLGELAGVSEGPMWDKVKAFGKKAGDTVMRHADITGYTKAKQNFEMWIDKHSELESEKENLLAKFDAEAEEDPHTPWNWGKEALAKWKEEKKQGSMASTESSDEISRIKSLSGIAQGMRM